MSVLDNLLAPLGYAKARRPDKAATVYRVMADDAQSWPDYAVMKNQAKAYKQSETTFFCVNLKAKTASSYEFMVSKRVSGEEGVESIPNHPLEMLIQRPNGEMQLTRQMLWISTISHICIHGNAYWYLAFNAKGEPEKIIPLRPDRVRIVPDAVKYVRGYTYTNAGQELALEPWEVVHFRNFHVSDDWYGLSDIEAGASSLEGDIHSAAEFNASLRNRGVPAMLVASKVNVVPDKWERFKREWRSQYDGYDNAGKTAFLENGQIEVTPVSVPMRDLQRLEMREYTSEQLMRVHGVPPALYAKNAIDANATAAGRYFLRTTIRPLHVLIAETITNQVASPFFGEELVCDFEGGHRGHCHGQRDAHGDYDPRRVSEAVFRPRPAAGARGAGAAASPSCATAATGAKCRVRGQASPAGGAGRGWA
jgi:HK97 family phage portal protein